MRIASNEAPRATAIGWGYVNVSGGVRAPHVKMSNMALSKFGRRRGPARSCQKATNAATPPPSHSMTYLNLPNERGTWCVQHWVDIGHETRWSGGTCTCISCACGCEPFHGNRRRGRRPYTFVPHACSPATEPLIPTTPPLPIGGAPVAPGHLQRDPHPHTPTRSLAPAPCTHMQVSSAVCGPATFGNRRPLAPPPSPAEPEPDACATAHRWPPPPFSLGTARQSFCRPQPHTI